MVTSTTVFRLATFSAVVTAGVPAAAQRAIENWVCSPSEDSQNAATLLGRDDGSKIVLFELRSLAMYITPENECVWGVQVGDGTLEMAPDGDHAELWYLPIYS
jgi:hypothetical protein